MTDRELDVLVAEKIMGLTLAGKRPAGFYDGEWCVFTVGKAMGDSPLQPVVESDGYFEVVEFYSSDVAAASKVVEEMIKRGWKVDLTCFPVDRHGCAAMWQVEIEPGEVAWAENTTLRGAVETTERGETLARAICVASLRVLGVEIPA